MPKSHLFNYVLGNPSDFDRVQRSRLYNDFHIKLQRQEMAIDGYYFVRRTTRLSAVLEPN